MALQKLAGRGTAVCRHALAPASPLVHGAKSQSQPSNGCLTRASSFLPVRCFERLGQLTPERCLAAVLTQDPEVGGPRGPLAVQPGSAPWQGCRMSPSQPRGPAAPGGVSERGASAQPFATAGVWGARCALRGLGDPEEADKVPSARGPHPAGQSGPAAIRWPHRSWESRPALGGGGSP